MSKVLSSLSNQCLLEALSVISCIYDIVLDARITSFFSIVVESITSNSPLWIRNEIKDSVFHVPEASLTTHGQVLFGRLFSGSLASLDCVMLSQGAFVDKILSLVMQPDHKLCDQALDVLRRQYRELKLFLY